MLRFLMTILIILAAWLLIVLVGTTPCATMRLFIGFYWSNISRGLWTWPPWVICAPAFNHIVGKAAHSGVSEVLLFTKSYKWKKQRWKRWTTGRLLLEITCFLRSPTVRQFKMADRLMRAEQKSDLLDVAWQCPDYSLLFPCSISFVESSVTCLRNKAHLLTKIFAKNHWIDWLTEETITST